MVVAELIAPKSIGRWRKGSFLNSNEGLFCESCNLGYTDEEYKILFSHKKIGYFLFNNSEDVQRLDILCHDCLFKKIKKIANGEELSLIILDDENEHICKFYPEETHDDDENDDFMDFTDLPFGSE
tara:strand:+ start:938 stop:1315 length:378 start_codon:yes stop_codon:yes gene_type:complete